MPQKLTTTACFIQEESSGGKQFRKHVSCFYTPMTTQPRTQALYLRPALRERPWLELVT